MEPAAATHSSKSEALQTLPPLPEPPFSLIPFTIKYTPIGSQEIVEAKDDVELDTKQAAQEPTCFIDLPPVTPHDGFGRLFTVLLVDLDAPPFLGVWLVWCRANIYANKPEAGDTVCTYQDPSVPGETHRFIAFLFEHDKALDFAHEARSTRRANFNLKEFARKEILKGPVGYCSFYINGQDKKGAAPWD